MSAPNFPIQLTSFIGRERDLEAVEQLLSAARLITLTGVGGSGKTRLVIQLANKVCEVFPDGVFFVDLVPLREPGLVLQLVVETLGLRLAPDQPLIEALLNFVRPRQLLIVLDNCEHLISACAQLAQELLLHSDELRILATSREPLGIPGERIYPLSGLAWPAVNGKTARQSLDKPDPQHLLSFDAVRLFVERAGLISPYFSLTSEDAPAVAEICRRLDGLPLAIELASARANVLTVQEISARLDDRFALLTFGQRSGLQPRHQTLRAAIDWSYALLTTEEQALLRRLAVFAAGCTLDTAQAVCVGEGIEAGRTLDLLSSLVDKSLVIAETTGRAQARYSLLETIREYAHEKLDEAGEADQLRDRHLDLFLARAEEAAPKLGDAYQQLWFNWLEGEHDNLRAALAWSLESGRIEAGLRICGAILRFWEVRGHVQESMAWFDRLLARADDRVPQVIRATAFTFAAFNAMFLGDAAAATKYGREAVALAEAAGQDGIAILPLALGGLSSGARLAGDFRTAFDIGERAIQLMRETRRSSFMLGMGLLTQGEIAVELGDYDSARLLIDESLALSHEAGDAFRTGFAHNILGDLACGEGNYAEAKTHYAECVSLFRQLGDQHYLAAFLRNLGRACLMVGEAGRARVHFTESLVMHQAEQNRAGMVECLIVLGWTAVVQGLPAEGTRLLAAASVLRGPRSPYVWPVKPLQVDSYLELARDQLSQAEFQAELAIGQALSLEQAIQYAQSLLLKPDAAQIISEEGNGLTRRERDVAARIARGRSNREIANELVLSPRTVEKHVANILSKLELSSRAQIVRWMMEHDLK